MRTRSDGSFPSEGIGTEIDSFSFFIFLHLASRIRSHFLSMLTPNDSHAAALLIEHISAVVSG